METLKKHDIEIVPVRGARQRREFVMLPYRLYRGDRNWVPPLVADEKKFILPRHNPFLKDNRVELFLCRRGGKSVGRVAAVLNRDHQRHHGDRCGFFGQFECVNDPVAAARLLQAAAAWLRENGCDTLRGPTSYSLNGVAGLLIDGFDRPPAVLMAYNPPYYRALLEGLGFRQVMRFFAYEVSRDTHPLFARCRAPAGAAERSGLHLPPLRPGPRRARHGHRHRPLQPGLGG